MSEKRVVGLYETLNHYLARRPEDLSHITGVWLYLGTRGYDISWVLSETREVPAVVTSSCLTATDAYTVEFGREEEP